MSSIATAEIARSCCFLTRVCAATPTSPSPISTTRLLRTNYPNGWVAKASTSLPENRGADMHLLAFRFFGPALALALVIAPGHGLVAQEWPERPVTVIVPFPAGGPA